MLLLDLDGDIGTLAAQIPSAACVLVEHGVDFCCSGRRSMVSALKEHHLDATKIREEIMRFPENTMPLEPRDDSPEQTISFIVERYLRPLGRRLSAIDALLHKIVTFHGEDQSRGYRRLKRAFTGLSTRLWENAREKEQLLYPAMLSSDLRSRKAACRALKRTNKITAEHLREFDTMKATLSFKDGRCASVRALDTSLTTLADETREAMRLENRLCEIYRSDAT